MERTEPVATQPAVCAQCETNARDNEAGGYLKLAAECRAYCLRGHREAPVSAPEGGSDRPLEQIATRLADTIVNATTTKYYDTSHQSDERIKRLLLDFAREVKRGAIEP